MHHRHTSPPAPVIPLHQIKGRGSARALQSRFEGWQRDQLDDGWDGLQPRAEDGAPLSAEGDTPAVRTQVIWENVKTAISRNQSPDIGFSQSLNPYRGCEHGCMYCYARPSHAYWGYSPGLDFETKIIAKRNLLEVLHAELCAPRYQCEPLMLGSNTDIYQPVERNIGLTRQVLELLSEAQHPTAIISKASLVERDIDLLAPMAQQQLAAVYISIPTLDADVARRMEPRAAAPYRRIQTIAKLHAAGIPVGVSLAPQIPFLTDDMEQVLEAAYAAGARRAFYVVLRLPHELTTLFRDWLELHYPDRAQRIIARVHDLHGGQDYRSTYGLRHTGSGIWAQLLSQRFTKACTRLGYNRERHPLNTQAFRAPSGQGWLF